MTPFDSRGGTWNKAKAVAALFPYTVWRERGGDNRMLDAWLAVIRDEQGRGYTAQPIVRLFGEEDFDFPNWIVTLVAPYARWERVSTNALHRWVAAAFAMPSTDEVGQTVVDILLQIASDRTLLPYIPVSTWAWLKKRPSLPLRCRGRCVGKVDYVVRRVRQLRDVEILESYFLLVWSEWDGIDGDACFSEMRTSIREDFGGIGMWRHREVLIERLDHILGQLDTGLEHLKQQNPYLREDGIQKARKQYGKLKKLLLEVDREAMEILTRTPFIYSFDLLTQAVVHRIQLDFRLCIPSPMSIVAPPRHSLLPTSILYSRIGPPLSLLSLHQCLSNAFKHICLPLLPDVRNVLHWHPRWNADQ